MNKIRIAIILIFAASLGQAQDLQQKDVPLVVVNAVKQKYPAMTEVQWKLKKEAYHAEFKIDKRSHDIWLDKAGTIKKYKQDIPKGDLPDVIKKKVESDFKGFLIDDADKIEKDEKVYYQLKLKSAVEERKVVFNADGSIDKNKVKLED